MHILAIETATDRSSVVLMEDDRELAAWRETTRQDLCRRLAAEAGRVLAAAGVEFPRIDLFAVGLGPGSFTSLRVGLATAKAFAYSLDKPLVGIPSLQAMCRQVQDRFSGTLFPMMDARRGEFYSAAYRPGPALPEAVIPEFVASPEQIAEKIRQAGAPVAVFGQAGRLRAEQIEMIEEAGAVILSGEVVPDARAVAALARIRLQSDGPDEPPRPGRAPLRPIYVRKSYAEEAADIDLGLR